MKNYSVLWLLPLLLFVGCSSLEQSARDANASLKAVLDQVQEENLASCQINPAQSNCQLINRAGAAQNALITASEAYCGWSTTAPPTDPNAKCVPVKGAEASLRSAIANAAEFTTELQGVLR